MTIEVSPIKATDIPSVVDCIQLAFDGDPYSNWAFDRRPGKFNKKRNYASLKAKCEWGIRNALFYVAKDTEDPKGTVLGVSMWMKPRKPTEPQSWSEWIDDYVLWFKQGLNVAWYMGWGGLKTRRYWVWKREQAKAQEEIWDDPNGYYFCNVVAVHPDAQGRGIGRKLVDIVTKTADAEGRKSYLESSKAQPNIPIYERMGFTLVKQMVCEEGGEVCDLYCMVREPQAVKP